jgi:hypothetical protein
MTEAVTSAPPLPLTLDEIDRDWLTAALRTRAPDVGLRGFEVLGVDHGTCTKVRLRLDLDEAGLRAGIAERVILKGGFEPHSRAMPYMHQAEVNSYRDVLPTLKLPSPACYFAAFSPERAQGIVIIEDLTARGVSLCHPLRPNTPGQAARRLTELARFHAQTWDSVELQPGGRWSYLPVLTEAGHLAAFLEPETWARFVALPRGWAASIYFHDRAWMAEALERLRILSRELPQAVLHGDTHLGNLYVEPDGTPGFFDSVPHRGAAIGEVAYHLGGALDPIDRRSTERDLVRFYLDELQRHGVAAPPLEDAMRQYAAFLAFGFCIFMVNDAVWQPESINTAYTARFSAAMADNDTIGALADIS